MCQVVLWQGSLFVPARFVGGEKSHTVGFYLGIGPGHWMPLQYLPAAKQNLLTLVMLPHCMFSPFALGAWTISWQGAWWQQLHCAATTARLWSRIYLFSGPLKEGLLSCIRFWGSDHLAPVQHLWQSKLFLCLHGQGENCVASPCSIARCSFCFKNVSFDNLSESFSCGKPAPHVETSTVSGFEVFIHLAHVQHLCQSKLFVFLGSVLLSS